MLRLGLGMGHDVPQIGVFHIHIGIGSGHDRCAGEALAKLGCQLQLLEVGRARYMLLGSRRLGGEVALIVLLHLHLLGDMMIGVTMMLWHTVARAGVVERTSFHSLCPGGGV